MLESKKEKYFNPFCREIVSRIKFQSNLFEEGSYGLTFLRKMCKVIVDFKRHERTQEDMKRFHMLKKSLPSFKSIISEVSSTQENESVYEK